MQRIEEARENNMESRFHKWFTKDNLIVLVLVGVLLFVISIPTKKSGENSEDTKVLSASEESIVRGRSADAVADAETQESALEEYAAKQEAKLEALLMSMEGVGKVEIMLTFTSSEELVVEKDSPIVRSNTVEKDSEGGSRTITQYEAGDSTVYSSSSGDSTPYVVKTLNPRVEGVLVVAQGAFDKEVSRNIAEAVQALFGVEAHRVKVVGMGGSTSTNHTTVGLSGN